MSGRPAGRPRNPGVDAAITEATLRLLDEVGYQRMSIAAVAQAAGVGRPALYRRHPSKADLVTAAIESMSPRSAPDVAGDPREALRGLVGAARDAVASPGGLAILGSLLAEQRRDPELLAAFRARIFDPHRAVVHAVVERAVQAGAVDRDADPEAVDALLFGALLARAILNEPADDPWTARVVAQLWRGLCPRAEETSNP